MSREYLATKLIAGKSDASLKTQWWPRHSRAMARYLALSADPAGLSGRKAVQELLFTGCRDWEVTVLRSSKAGLMEEHAKLEVELVNAIIRRDGPEITKIGDLLLENVRQQTTLHAAKGESFPVKTWHDLLQHHVGLFIESAEYHMQNDDRNFEECERRRQVNTLALAAFTAEWL